MANASERKIKLYYLGGLKTKSGIVTAGQKPYQLPPAGDFIEIEKHRADELIAKHKYTMPDGEYVSTFTTDKRIAARIKAGLSPIEARTVLNVDKLSNADFIAEAKRRGLSIQTDDSAEEDNEAEADEEPEDEKPAAKPTRRGKKVEPEPEEPEDVNTGVDQELAKALGAGGHS